MFGLSFDGHIFLQATRDVFTVRKYFLFIPFNSWKCVADGLFLTKTGVNETQCALTFSEMYSGFSERKKGKDANPD